MLLRLIHYLLLVNFANWHIEGVLKTIVWLFFNYSGWNIKWAFKMSVNSNFISVIGSSIQWLLYVLYQLFNTFQLIHGSLAKEILHLLRCEIRFCSDFLNQCVYFICKVLRWCWAVIDFSRTYNTRKNLIFLPIVIAIRDILVFFVMLGQLMLHFW